MISISSAVCFSVTVSNGNLERYSGIRLLDTDRKEYSHKYNELLHICLSLIRDAVFIAVKMDETASEKFNRSVTVSV